MQKYNFRPRILIPLTLALAILLTGFVVSFYRYQAWHLNADIFNELKSMSKLIANQLNNDTQTMRTGLEILLHDKQLQTVLKNKDREALLEQSLSFFKQLQSRHRITHFYFTGPDRINILRVHKPDKYGDKIDRYTTLEAERSGKFSSGIELGLLGTFTLRVVAPWYEDDRLIGYVEFGEEIEHITQKLHDILNVELYLFVKKKFLTRENWEAGMRMLGRKPAWDQFSEIVMIDQTGKLFPENLIKLLNKAHHTSMQHDAEVLLNQREYRAGFLPLKDVSGNAVGAMLILLDVTDMNSGLHASIFYVSAICLSVGGILFVLFHIFLGQIERQMAISSEAFKESEEKYRSMLEAMNDAVYICSPDFRVEYLNPAMTKRTGYNALGEFCYNRIYGLDEKCPWCVHGKVMQGKHIKTKVVSPKDGNSYHISNSPIFHTNGSVSKLAISRDITEVKKMEEKLQQSQKMEAIGSLAGGIAHDFNNILTSIIGYTDLALEAVEKGSLLEEDLKAVKTAGDRAKDLVRQILAFSRQNTQELKPIMPSLIVKEVTKLLRSSIPTTIDIKHNIESDSLIMGDPTQVHQVLMNLCTNAAHAMGDSGGTLTVDLTDVKLDDSFTRKYEDFTAGDYLKLTICDTGTGIKPDIIGSIFDPYFTTKDIDEGTGLGLPVAHGIVKALGGEMTVESEIGSGSTFTVYLPVLKESMKVELKTLDVLPGGKENILLIDDEVPIVNLCKQMLTSLGYNVTTRTCSLEAKELFKNRPEDFDLVLTDMTMPNMTGDRLAIELMKIRPDIPVILCTGYSKKMSGKSAAKIGIKAFVMKPFVKSEMARIVRKVLDADLRVRPSLAET